MAPEEGGRARERARERGRGRSRPRGRERSRVRASESICAGDCQTKRGCHGVRLRRQSVGLVLVQIEEKRGAWCGHQLTDSLRVLQCVTVCCRSRLPTRRPTPCVTACWSVLQAAAANSQAHSVCYSVLQCVAGCGRQLTGSLRVLQCVAVYCRPRPPTHDLTPHHRLPYRAYLYSLTVVQTRCVFPSGVLW